MIAIYAKGLTSAEVEERLKKFGKNEIKEVKKVSKLKILLSQFTSPIILVLLAASVVSYLTGFISGSPDYIDTFLILLIVFMSGLLGFVQDYKAESAIEALKKIATPRARVIRNGRETEILATEVVPDDVLVLSAGDVVPADAKILKGSLELDESVLTGESKSVKKKKGDKVFSGTFIYAGYALAKVFATGMETEVGKLAKKMGEMEEERSPFEIEMSTFAKRIVVFILAILIVLFFTGYAKFGPVESLMISVSLAVAAIPEGLPAVVTIALSFGAKRMARRNALMRRLATVESIGTIDTVCTDKTGTLTEGKMKVRGFYLENYIRAEDVENDLVVKCCYICNDAKPVVKDGNEITVGDETDIALKEFSAKKFKWIFERIDEIPFTSERKMMTVVANVEGKKLVFSKGAPEVLLGKCTRMLKAGEVKRMTPGDKKRVMKKVNEFASRGARVLALAYKEMKKPYEEKLIYLGLVILSDPPRKGVKEAVEDCHSAGIRVVMITGDNPETARAIGEEVGIFSQRVLTGKDIERMKEKEFKRVVEEVNIFARVDPFHKLKILEALQKNGHVVAMTGDGVNDSLAVKKSNVGISMGIRGTEVTKETSDIVLLDDNFASIRNAIEEGRRIFDNIRKFVNYLFTCNIAEIAVIFLATLIFPFIFLFPVEILWINLITDGLPAIALSFEPPAENIMKRKPRKREEGIINRKMVALIITVGFLLTALIFLSFFLTLPLGIKTARTVAFTAFVTLEISRIIAIKYDEGSRFRKWFENRLLFLSLVASLLLQAALIYSPAATYFNLVPLGVFEWSVLLAVTIASIVLGIASSNIVGRLVKKKG